MFTFDLEGLSWHHWLRDTRPYTISYFSFDKWVFDTYILGFLDGGTSIKTE